MYTKGTSCGVPTGINFARLGFSLNQICLFPDGHELIAFTANG